MKKVVSKMVLAMFAVLCLTSCYTLRYNVGEGAKTGIKVVEKNHYLIDGLAGIKTANPTQMAGDTKDYTVTITHSFIDGLLSALTGGIYTPTTVIVEK